MSLFARRICNRAALKRQRRRRTYGCGEDFFDEEEGYVVVPDEGEDSKINATLADFTKQFKDRSIAERVELLARSQTRQNRF